MKRPANLKVGDLFRVINEGHDFNLGEIISLKIDDDTTCPLFWKEDKSLYRYINFSHLEPYPKTIRDVQVGDMVVWKTTRYEFMVLERWQKTVLLSYHNKSEKMLSNIYEFDDLEKYFSLKDVPEVDDKTAEAMELLKKAGYKITKE